MNEYLNSKFFRNNLIQMLILTFGLVLMFCDFYFNGKDIGNLKVLFVIGLITIIGDIWLYYMMKRAKRLEQEALKFPQSQFTTESLEKRVYQRKIILLCTLGVSIIFIFMGLKGLEWNYVPLHYWGLGLLGLYSLGLMGFNIWKGGPLDIDKDPPNK